VSNADPRAIAERLGVPEGAVRGVQRHGFLRRLALEDGEIRARLWRAHTELRPRAAAENRQLETEEES
jgi:hypothetical protein